MNDDWNKLSPKEKNKIRELCGNNWTDIKVFSQDFDNREGADRKINYGTFLIKYKIGNKSFQTTISRQTRGY